MAAESATCEMGFKQYFTIVFILLSKWLHNSFQHFLLSFSVLFLVAKNLLLTIYILAIPVGDAI